MLIVLPFLINSVLSFAIGLLVAKALGPAEYGRFALALSVAVVIQTLGFEWLRLAVLRFYSSDDRESAPEIRSTIDACFLAALAAAAGAAAFILIAQAPIPPNPALAALAVGAAGANAAFDFAAALARARFLDRAYGRLVIVKNILAVLLTIGGAWWFQSAEIALAGLILSAAGSIGFGYRALRDSTRGVAPHWALARQFIAYGTPIVIANALYQIVPMVNRGLTAERLDYAQAGQLALSFETGVRVIGAIGSSLDVILFQLAVFAEKRSGRHSARAQISRNFGLVLAILTPATLGCAAIMPSFELLLAPKSFQGPFGSYFMLMTPALFAFGLMNYAVYPAFQIERRTAPLIIAALFALIVDLAAIQLLPQALDARNFAIAQSLSSVAGLLALLIAMAFLAPFWPSARDCLGVALGSALMMAAIWPLRAFEPGVLTLSAQIILGAFIYGAAALAFNVADIRSFLMEKRAGRTKR